MEQGVDAGQALLAVEDEASECFIGLRGRSSRTLRFIRLPNTEVPSWIFSVQGAYIFLYCLTFPDGKDVCWVQVESSLQPVYVEDANDFKFSGRGDGTILEV